MKSNQQRRVSAQFVPQLSVPMLVTELTRITGILSRMCGDGDTRARHVLHRCLETSENMDSQALAIVGASNWRAYIHLAA